MALPSRDGTIGGAEGPVVENSPAPYRSLRALRARRAPGSVRESVSKNRGVPESVWGSALAAFLKVT